jgi:two-component system, LytTR family, sensor histidine kinase AlgZ
MSTANPPKTPSASVMPDCCHIGVIARALLAVNFIVLIVLVLQASSWKVGFTTFFESAMLLEWSSLLSLAGLCGVRKLLLWRGWLLPEWAQRTLCALVPMLLVGGMTCFLLTVDWFATSFPSMTLPVMSGLAALFGLVLQHYFELRTRAYSPALSEARLQALQARIRPHFLFNSLNAVLSLIRTEPLRAETTLEDLADLFRVHMRETRDLTSLGEEIHLCRQYLSIEKIRLGERLHVQWHLSNITDILLQRAQIPILLLQPLLENAVYYGVECATKVSVIHINLSRSLDRIEIVVTNPFHGEFKSRGGNKMALMNIQQRLTLLYDVEAQLTFGVVQGQYEVRLRFPYVKLAQKERTS